MDPHFSSHSHCFSELFVAIQLIPISRFCIYFSLSSENHFCSISDNYMSHMIIYIFTTFLMLESTDWLQTNKYTAAVT